MQHIALVKAAPRRGRLAGLFLALLLQAGFVWALVAGLSIKDIPVFIAPAIDVIIPKKTVLPPPPPFDDRMVQPQDTTKPIKPDFVIEGGGGDQPFEPFQPARPGPADHGPAGIAATHTTPPYPPIEARLGHAGTVMLRLTISATGTVSEAVVIRSSGYERLDEAAAAWVKTYWRYQPAVRGGVAVPSTGRITVTFDLRNAG